MLGREHRKFLEKAGIPPKRSREIAPQEDTSISTPAKYKGLADDLRTSIEKAEAEIRRLQQDIRRWKKRMKQLSQWASDEAPGLQKGKTVRTVGQMSQNRTAPEESGGGPGRKLSDKHPFPRTLKERGLKMAAWARAHEYDPDEVRSWYRGTKSQRNRIPRAAALVIESEFGLPADETTWPQGLR